MQRSEAFESFHLLNGAIDVNEHGEIAYISRSGERGQISSERSSPAFCVKASLRSVMGRG